jgi:hypothetical protein
MVGLVPGVCLEGFCADELFMSTGSVQADDLANWSRSGKGTRTNIGHQHLEAIATVGAWTENTAIRP